MTTVIPMASRRAAPTAPTVNAVHQPTDLVHLHMAAVNHLNHALRQLTGPDCSAEGWATATAKARRAFSALKQGCALLHEHG